MALQRMYKIAWGGIPELAGSIIASCNKLIPILIKVAVGEWQDMSLKFFIELEFLLSLFLYFFDEF